MADPSNNPPPTPPSPASPNSPWIYSGIPAGGYYTPPAGPAGTPDPTPAPTGGAGPQSGATPAPGSPASPAGASATPAEATDAAAPQAGAPGAAAPHAGATAAAGTPASPAPAAIPQAGPTPAATPPSDPAPAPSAGAAPAPPAPVPTAPAPPKEKPKEEDASLAGVIDTIEAIIIALIVALTFRAFIVEAFVIPTGSMAPTLLGAHYKVICPKCGYEFDMDANLRRQVARFRDGRFAGQTGIPQNDDPQAELGDNRGVPLPVDEMLPLVCPNCRYAIPYRDLPQYLEPVMMPDFRRGGGVQPVEFAWANNGDRILVLKYLYAVMEPKRWDVIVFKEPERADSNYIKRLIGLPGDTVEIVNGDIFIRPRGSTRPEDFQIARKPEDIQQALWQLVYNNDFYPTDEGKRRSQSLPDWSDPVWTNPWEPDAAHAGAWSKGPVMAYAGGKGGGETSALQFHLLPEGAPSNYPPYSLNTLGYNTDLYVSANEFAPRSIVGDLRLETLWYPKQAGSAITLTLGRPNNCYRFTWGPSGMKLEHLVLKVNAADAPDHWVEVAADQIQGPGGAGVPPPQAGKAYHLAMNNVDHAVQFYVDGTKVLSLAEPWSVSEAIKDVVRYPADWTNSPEENQARANTMIQVDVKGPCELSHLKVFRDLYYTQVNDAHFPATGTMAHPVTLKDDEFFALGDNSRRSADGRIWAQVHPPLGDLGVRDGIVPRRYLLGKAFFVYWPAGYTPLDPRSAVPVLNNLPLIPDTGEMRIIR